MTIHTSSKRQNWATSQPFYNLLNKEFHFGLDAAADSTNHKCPRWFGEGGEQVDAFSVRWPKDTTIFLNPPYGSGVKKFCKKANEEKKRGAKIVMLVAARPEIWFQDAFWDWEIRFLRGRLTFGSDEYWEWVWQQEFIDGKKNNLYGKIGKKNTAGFPSAVCVSSGNSRLFWDWKKEMQYMDYVWRVGFCTKCKKRTKHYYSWQGQKCAWCEGVYR